MKNYNIAIEKIKKADNIVIYTHANVDGDAIGSAFAFYFLLKGMGKKVDVFAKTTMPNQLKFLEIEDILNKKTIDKYNLAIVVDCNTIEMTSVYVDEFYKIPESVQFDHHRNNPSYADINIVEPNMSSACELIANVLSETNTKINKKTAEFLLCGMITDSGGFRFASVTSKTLLTAYKLIDEFNLDLSYYMHNLFESESKEYLKMYKEAINNTELLCNDQVAIITLPYRFFKETGIDPNSSKNLTRIGTEIKSVIATALISEVEPNVSKVSFRSRKGYDCSLCAAVFGGGGHREASGCKIFGNLNDTKDKVLKAITDGLL